MLTDSFIAVEYDISLAQAKGMRALCGMALVVLSQADTKEDFARLIDRVSTCVAVIVEAIDEPGGAKLIRAYKALTDEALERVEAAARH